MKEKIFKAKRKNWRELPKENQWVYGTIFEGKENSYIITNIKVTDEWEDNEIGADVIGYLVDAETICEPTGMTDKKGNKVYEHDTIKGVYSDQLGEPHSFKIENLDILDYATLNMINYSNECEVCGNIFDNDKN